MSSLQFYYMGNPISVPYVDLGNLDRIPTTGASPTGLNLAAGTAGTFVTRYAEGAPPASISAGQMLNTSNSPIYPQIGDSNYIKISEDTNFPGYYKYEAVGAQGVAITARTTVAVQTYDRTQVYLAIAEISNVTHLGFLLYHPAPVFAYPAGIWCFCYQTRTTDSLEIILSRLTFTPDPGEDGFKPVRDRPKKPAFGGGRISGWQPAYKTDTLTQPGAPDESVASAVRSGLINLYELSEANLKALGRALFGTEGVDGLVTKLQNSFLNPLDAILSLQIFPCSPDVGSSEHIKVLDWSSYVAKLGTDASGNRLSSQYKTFDFGSISVDEEWESFLDYDNTSFELYLPFIGSVDLPIDEVMGGSVNIQYTVDFLTGMCVANVLCTKNVPLFSDRSVPQYAQHSYMGNCAVQIPLNNVSYGNIIGSLMNAASSGLRGGAGGAIMSIVESGLSGGFKPEVSTKGTISANAGFCSVLYPYVTITRPIAAEPDAFQEVMGYTSYIESTLGSYDGLCVCDEIDLTGIAGATDSELEEIRNICKSGIYV